MSQESIAVIQQNELNNMKVPFQDLHKQYLSIKGEIDSAIERVISESSFVRGPHVDLFENNFASLLGSKYCISCGNGTDSLFIAIKALGAKPGDEIIVPAHSWISTSEVVTLAGCKVVFADTDSDTFNISISDLEKKITDKTVGVIPVHLFGQAAKIEEIINIAEKNSLWVIEDTAQAHLATRNNVKVGTIGDFGSFSFYPGKNLGAMGDAGCLITNNKNLSEKAQMIARHGGLTKGDHKIEGLNSRMDGLQAAILNIKIKRLENWTESRIRLASIYSNDLADIEAINTPVLENNSTHVYHLYVIKVMDGNRDELQEFLMENNISTGINYPVALPFLDAYKYLNHNKNDFPNAFKNQSSILSLPIFPEMTEDQVKFVTKKIKEFYSN